MAKSESSKGFLLPGLPQVLLAASIVGGAYLWKQDHRHREAALLQQEQSESPVDRFQKIEDLVAQGDVAIPELVATARDPDARKRRLAILGLGRIGSPAALEIDIVRQALTDEDAQTRRQAVRALWKLLPDLDSSLPLVAARLADTDVEVRTSAAEILQTLGTPAVATTIEMLRDESPGVRLCVLQLLGDLRPFAPVETINSAVRGSLSHPDDQVRIAALYQLVATDQATIAELRDLLTSPVTASTEGISYRPQRPTSFEVALEAITRRGPAAAALVPDLLDVLPAALEAETRQERPPRWRSLLIEIVQALRSMKTSARAAVPILLLRVRDLRLDLQVLILETVLELGASPDEVTPLATEQFDTAIGQLTSGHGIQQLPVQQRIVQDAGRLLLETDVAAARRELDHLRPWLTSQKPDQLLGALIGIQGVAAVAGFTASDLIPLLTHADPRVRRQSISTLGRIGAAAAPSVPALLAQFQLAKRRDPEICEGILQAFGEIGPAAEQCLPLLVKIVDTPGDFVGWNTVSDDNHGKRYSWGLKLQRAALISLGRIDQPTPDVTNCLERHVRSRVPGTSLAGTSQEIAVQAWSLIDGDSADLYALFEPQLLHPDPVVRGHAALNVGRWGWHSPAILAALVRLLDDDSPYVRIATAVSLGKFGPAAESALPALRNLQDRPGNSLPLSAHSPVRWKPGPATFAGIPELSGTTLETALAAAIRQITANESVPPQDK